jgi:hypothetical protein
MTVQLGYSFEYDAAKPEAEWKNAGDVDLGPGPAALELVRRDVPPSEVMAEVAESIVAQGRLDGSMPSDIPAVGMDATAMFPVASNAFFEADGRSVRPEFFNDGFYVLADLGREECGLLSLDVETDEGAVVDIGHAEHMENGRIKVKLNSYLFAGRYRTAEGVNRYCRWEKRMAGRYIQLHVRNVKTRFKINRLTVKPVVFPVDEMPLPPTVRSGATPCTAGTSSGATAMSGGFPACGPISSSTTWSASTTSGALTSISPSPPAARRPSAAIGSRAPAWISSGRSAIVWATSS